MTAVKPANAAASLTAPAHFTNLSVGRWTFLVVAACFIAPASLFVHDFMLDWLRVPYPKVVGLPTWATALMLAAKLVGVAIFCRLAAANLRQTPAALVASGLGVVVLMLHETARVIFIEHSIFNSWAVALLDGGAAAISLFLEVSIVAYASLKGARRRAMLAVIAVVTLAGAVFVSPWLSTQFNHLRSVDFGNIKELYTDPYPPKVNVIIYSGFIEPTAATFVLAALCWNGLPQGAIKRVGAFTALLLLIRGRFILELVFSFWVRHPLPTAFLATGQFFLETMVLGLLAGMVWSWIVPKGLNSPVQDASDAVDVRQAQA